MNTPTGNADSLRSFVGGVAKRAAPDGRHAIVWAPFPHHDTPADMDRPVNDGGEWRPYSEVDAESKRLVLVTPAEFDRDAWTAPETAGNVPPEPDNL
jgi:hypothetical protein